MDFPGEYPFLSGQEYIIANQHLKNAFDRKPTCLSSTLRVLNNKYRNVCAACIAGKQLEQASLLCRRTEWYISDIQQPQAAA